MHPILLRIPLPKGPLKLWWAAVAVAVIVGLYGAFMLWRRQAKGEAYWSFAIAAALGIAGYTYRASTYEAENVPIYSYGVMLGVSLIVGWYITLPLAKRDGLPAETMANCYVVTALAALAGSRILYILTNPSEFQTEGKAFGEMMGMYFQIRKGGLVAYGGFLGGFLGSWAYLRSKHLKLMPWADVAVPSLASGLFITRIGCYLYGCDFGKRLSDHAPGFLKKIGTFPHLPDGTLGYADNGLPIIGSPAYARHLTLCQEGVFHGKDCHDMTASLPVHPTQLYESLIGLGLLLFLLYMRKRQVFRGQIFFLFTFGYGLLRFMLELLRDDVERGDVGPAVGEHVLMAGSLLLFAVAFAYGPALSIANERMRTVARIGAFVPAIALYLALRPASFGSIQVVKLSTSQAIGLFSAVAVAFFYARFWLESKRNPEAAMDLGLPEEEKPKRKKKKRRKPEPPKPVEKPTEEEAEET
jgi:phosphatidylglycerol:prolipoprotein diacylglycerol transferase